MARTKGTVTLSRTDWNAIVASLEDAADLAALRASEARRGDDDALPVTLYRQIRAGAHPVRVWRGHRGLGLNQLAARAKLQRSYLSEIETGRKPGSAAALKRLAQALGVAMDDLVRDPDLKREK